MSVSRVVDTSRFWERMRVWNLSGSRKKTGVVLARGHRRGVRVRADGQILLTLDSPPTPNPPSVESLADDVAERFHPCVSQLIREPPCGDDHRPRSPLCCRAWPTSVDLGLGLHGQGSTRAFRSSIVSVVDIRSGDSPLIADVRRSGSRPSQADPGVTTRHLLPLSYGPFRQRGGSCVPGHWGMISNAKEPA
jgi:hypothetical protein